MENSNRLFLKFSSCEQLSHNIKLLVHPHWRLSFFGHFPIMILIFFCPFAQFFEPNEGFLWFFYFRNCERQTPLFICWADRPPSSPTNLSMSELCFSKKYRSDTDFWFFCNFFPRNYSEMVKNQTVFIFKLHFSFSQPGKNIFRFIFAKRVYGSLVCVIDYNQFDWSSFQHEKHIIDIGGSNSWAYFVFLLSHK